MGKEVDFEALAAEYAWEHLKKLNVEVSPLKRWRSDNLITPARNTVLFTMPLVSLKEGVREEIDLPVAILTEDGILRFLIGSGEVDLKEHRQVRGWDRIG